MPIDLLPGVHDIPCANTETGRIRAFLSDDGNLIDCGLPDTSDTLLDEIAETRIHVDSLKITHADRDHVGGFDAVVQELSPETYVSVGAEFDTESDPDNRYANSNEIGLFEAVHVPGHREHQHALTDEDRGVAILTDALSRADQSVQPAGYFHLPPGIYSGDLNEAETSLERPLEYNFEARLVPTGS